MDWVDPLIKVSTSAGFGALVWYLFVVHMPRVEERHRADRTQWTEALKERDHEIREVIDNYHRAVSNYATVMERVTDKLDMLLDKWTGSKP